MDPVTAFSLACGVVQVVDFSLRLLSKSKEIHEKGSLEENDSLEFLTHHLSDLKLKLDTPLNSSHGRAQSQNERDLKHLAEKCSETAQILLMELGKLKISDPRKKRHVIKVSLRAVLKKGTLKELEAKMNCYRDLLNTQILVGLRRTNETLQKLLLSFAENPYTFEQFINLIDHECKSTREFVGNELKQLEISAAERKYQDEFLASLHFPEINCRQEEIKDAYKKTFQWIFDHSGKKVRPWSNFIEWLENGSGTYWMSGKPGSGKSTLMNYICQDDRTKEALHAWAGGRELLIPCFFFWAAGSKLQKSVPGLLRSLIYQILKGNRSLIATVVQRNITPCSPDDYTQGLEPNTVWTEKKLLTYFSALLDTMAESHRICFFIDGLDEFDGDHYELVGDVISEMTQRNGIKCCVSSRPEKPFQEFELPYMLRLQDLTRLDIEEFVHSKLGPVLPRMAHLPAEDKDYKLELMKQVVDKADGVFLWVELAVKSQIIGIRFNDSFEVLQQRIRSLPPMIDDLYSDMLRRIDPAHYQEAARYINYARFLKSYRSSVFNFTLARFGLTDDMDLNSQVLNTETIVPKCAHVCDRISSICAGFLEIYEDPFLHPLDIGFDWEGNDAVEWFRWERDPSLIDRFKTDWSRRMVRFCHRTAFDFFGESEGNGQLFLEENCPLKSRAVFIEPMVSLARMSMCNLVNSKDFMSSMIYNIMQLLRSLDLESSDDDLSVVKEVLGQMDGAIGAIDKRFNHPSDDSHWCTRWGKYHVRNYSSENRRNVKYMIAPKMDTPHHSPSNFLSFAASYELDGYVGEVLNQRGNDINSDEATHLAICAVARMESTTPNGGWREWRIAYVSQFQLVVRLVHLGADPREGLNWSIWEEVVRYIYDGFMTRRLDPQIVADLPQILETFLRIGVDPYPTIFFSCNSPGGYSSKAFFECDTSLSPLQPIIEVYASQYGLQRHKTIRRRASTVTPLRIWFQSTPDNVDSLWPPQRHSLTNEQINLLHTNVENIISCPTKEIFNERSRELDEAIEEIYHTCHNQHKTVEKSQVFEFSEDGGMAKRDEEDNKDNEDKED